MAGCEARCARDRRDGGDGLGSPVLAGPRGGARGEALGFGSFPEGGRSAGTLRGGLPGTALEASCLPFLREGEAGGWGGLGREDVVGRAGGCQQQEGRGVWVQSQGGAAGTAAMARWPWLRQAWSPAWALARGAGGPGARARVGGSGPQAVTSCLAWGRGLFLQQGEVCPGTAWAA